MPGPAPKKDSERTRRNTPESGQARHGEFRPVTIPNADVKNWHARATALFNALKTSGQADFYQDSDWAYAKFVCDYMTKCYDTGMKAMDMANLATMLGRLGATEIDRRKDGRIELEKPEVETTSASVTAIADYRQRLGAVPNLPESAAS